RLGLTLDYGRGCRRLFLGGRLLLPAFLYVVFLHVPQHVFLEQPTTRAGRRNVLRRQTVLVEQTAGRRHHAYAAHFFLALGCRVVTGLRFGCGSLFLLGGRLSCALGRRAAAAAVFAGLVLRLKQADHLAYVGRVAFLLEDLGHHAGGGRKDLDTGLIRFNLDQF